MKDKERLLIICVLFAQADQGAFAFVPGFIQANKNGLENIFKKKE